MKTVFLLKTSLYGSLNHLLLLVFSILAINNTAYSADLNLAWDPSPSTVGGYKLYYGQTSKNYTSNIDVGNVTTYKITGLTAGGTYYFAMKSYDTTKSSQSVSYSNEVSATIPVTTPTCTVTQTLINNVCQTKTCPAAQQLSAQGVCFTPTTTCPVTQTLVNNVCQTKTCPAGQQLNAQGVCITPSTISGLVAAYSFDEIGNATTADASGNGNHGTILEAARTPPSGTMGRALNFDGVNDWVTIKDSASLDLSSGYTLEAWVKPLAIHSGTVMIKEQPSGAVYNLYAFEDADLPIASFNDGNYEVISGTTQLPINQWSHLAATYDGTAKVQRLYVNGAQVSSRTQAGLIQQSNGNLHIGGNSIWGEFFQGYIDEVRIYNKALTSSQIVTDLSTAISVSNPPQPVVGYNKILEPFATQVPQGLAEAYQITPQKTVAVTALQVFLDQKSTATTELTAGIYTDLNGHPGLLQTQGKITSPKANATNTVSIPAVSLVAGQRYWIAILGSKGQIVFRNKKGSTVTNATVAPMETSAATTLTALPSKWATGTAYPIDGPMSIYGSGY